MNYMKRDLNWGMFKKLAMVTFFRFPNCSIMINVIADVWNVERITM